jgi:hypothetical protein
MGMFNLFRPKQSKIGRIEGIYFWLLGVVVTATNNSVGSDGLDFLLAKLQGVGLGFKKPCAEVPFGAIA